MSSLVCSGVWDRNTHSWAGAVVGRRTGGSRPLSQGCGGERLQPTAGVGDSGGTGREVVCSFTAHARLCCDGLASRASWQVGLTCLGSISHRRPATGDQATGDQATRDHSKSSQATASRLLAPPATAGPATSTRESVHHPLTYAGNCMHEHMQPTGSSLASPVSTLPLWAYPSYAAD